MSWFMIIMKCRSSFINVKIGVNLSIKHRSFLKFYGLSYILKAIQCTLFKNSRKIYWNATSLYVSLPLKRYRLNDPLPCDKTSFWTLEVRAPPFLNSTNRTVLTTVDTTGTTNRFSALKRHASTSRTGLYLQAVNFARDTYT